VPSRQRVAIVDDEEFVVLGLQETLEAHGYAVAAVAHSYEDAVALVERREACEIAFVDLGLGGKPAGIDIARRAVRNGWAVVVMTGGASLPADLAGAALLLKPFSDESVRTVLHTLGRRDRPSPAA
jgi:DNA-binding response OmpR family regulator